MARSPKWTCAHASVAGAHHRSAGREKQDTLALHHTAGDRGTTLFIALADGAGNAPLGQAGSLAAATAAQQVVTNSKGRPREQAPAVTLQEAHQAAVVAVTELAQRDNRTLREYDTTLILALIDDGQLAVCQTGDGAVVVRTDDGQLLLAAPPRKGRYPNETSFITEQPTPAPVIREMGIGRITGVVVFSDGLEPFLLNRQLQPHPPALGPLFQWADPIVDPNAANQELAEQWQSPGIADRSRDDITICVAVRQPAGPEPRGQ